MILCRFFAVRFVHDGGCGDESDDGDGDEQTDETHAGNEQGLGLRRGIQVICKGSHVTRFSVYCEHNKISVMFRKTIKNVCVPNKNMTTPEGSLIMPKASTVRGGAPVSEGYTPSSSLSLSLDQPKAKSESAWHKHRFAIAIAMVVLAFVLLIVSGVIEASMNNPLLKSWYGTTFQVSAPNGAKGPEYKVRLVPQSVTFSQIALWNTPSWSGSLARSVLTAPHRNPDSPAFVIDMIRRFGNVNLAAKYPRTYTLITPYEMYSGLAYDIKKKLDAAGISGGNSPNWPELKRPSDAFVFNLWLLTSGPCEGSDSTASCLLTDMQVVQTYGDITDWNYSTWYLWLRSRIRTPYEPFVDATPDVDQCYAVSGSFEWGFPWWQPSNCFSVMSSKCMGTIFGIDVSEGKHLPDPASWYWCAKPNLSNPLVLEAWQDLLNKGDALPGINQTPDNNPFVKFGISVNSPLILEFLGYGFVNIDLPILQLADKYEGKGLMFQGGVGKNTSTQIDQFLVLVSNGGFYGYAENNRNMDSTQLYNYCWGSYNFETVYGDVPVPRPGQTCPTTPSSTGFDIASSAVSTGIAVGGLGMIAGPLSMLGLGLIGLLVGGGLAAGKHAAAGDFNTPPAGCGK